jgi:CheY-like chemotaxis protein
MKASKRVLVVDDDPVVGLSFDRILTPKGYAVMSVRSGAEALERLAREDYDVVYTDIRMPGMDGLEVARRIKASRPWLPVLIVTGYGNDENEATAKDIGVAQFLQKPLTPDTIEESAKEALRAPSAAWAAVTIPAAAPPAPAPAAAPAPRMASVGRFAKNVALFFAAPFITLAWVVVGPIALLGMLAWTGVKSIRTASKEGPR